MWGYDIFKGMMVIFYVGVLVLDEEIWSDLFEFWLERFMNLEKWEMKGYMLFGVGRRLCFGFSMGLLYLYLLLVNLLYVFEWGLEVVGKVVDFMEKFWMVVIMKIWLCVFIMERLYFLLIVDYCKYVSFDYWKFWFFW